MDGFVRSLQARRRRADPVRPRGHGCAMTRHGPKDLFGDRRGTVLVTVALSMGLILGFAALAVDTGYLYALKSRLQVTADAAALAAISQLPDETAARSAAADFAGKNMATSQHGTVLADADVVLGNWDPVTRTFTPAPGADPIDAVRVITKRSQANNNPVELFFARFLGIEESQIETIAVAWRGGESGEFCILALEPNDSAAVQVSGTVTLDLGECGIAVKSTHPSQALKLSGTVDITAGSICVAGGAQLSGAVTLSPGPEIVETSGACDPPPDPLADLAPPTNTGCDYYDYTLSSQGNTVTLSPGVYCGGITVSGSDNTVNFQPGTYIIAGGGMQLSGGANTYNGTEVMFYNTESAPGAGDYEDLTFSGNSTVNLSAPPTGPYAGVLFFQDRDPEAKDVKFQVSGTVTTKIDGVIYFPNQEVKYSGTSSVTEPCGPKIIAKTVKFSGTSETFGGPGCVSDAVSIGGGGSLRLVF